MNARSPRTGSAFFGANLHDDTIQGLYDRYMRELSLESIINETLCRLKRDPQLTQLFYSGETMFTETLIKTNIVAVRAIADPSNASSTMVVTIYEREGYAGVEELLFTRRRFERVFNETTMAARIRHSINWINKLDREHRLDYWVNGCAEFNATQETRIFFDEPVSRGGFRERMQSLATLERRSSPAQQGVAPQGIAPADIVRAFQTAVDGVLSVGATSRNTLGLRFAQTIRDLTSGGPRA